jgi:tRNA pseudouridine38-40 synthase
LRYFLHLTYDGTNYCGWQVQANAPSVQETINKALEKLLGQRIGSMGCGRTDTGRACQGFLHAF